MKNDTSNYKVKYAIMEINRTISSSGVSKNYKYFIPAKCYVTSKKETYLNNRETKIIYNVVFITPDLNEQSKLIQPQYNFYGDCINSIPTDKIFDTYGEAKNEASPKNINYYRYLRTQLSFSGGIKKQLDILNNDYKLLTKYGQEIESYLLDITDEIKISYLPLLPEEQINTILSKLIQLPLIQSDEFLCSLNEREISLLLEIASLNNTEKSKKLIK